MNIICPNCKEILEKTNNTYKCINNHSFDISKDGYTNLILANAKKSKNPGDNKEMCDARKRFLGAGYYECLSDEINRIIAQSHYEKILDVGCCEGYYTHRLDKYLVYPHQIIGIDISKDSIKLASKKEDNCEYIVASSKSLPIQNSSVDVIINNFAPHNEEEFLKVLKNGGIVIKVTPAPKHLLGLKEQLFDKVIIKETPSKLEGFEVKKDYELSYEIEVQKEHILDLLTMTPFYYKTTEEEKTKLTTLDTLKTLVCFNLTIYQKK